MVIDEVYAIIIIRKVVEVRVLASLNEEGFLSA